MALTLASSLATHLSTSPVAPLAVVIHASHAHVGEASASAGTTIYDGDRLSTETEGSLRIFSPSLSLQLDPQTALTLQVAAVPHPAATTVDLTSGTLIFSAARAASFAILANGAVLRPAGGTPTIAKIKIINRRELHIFAQRGSLELSYRCETEVIAEGNSYGVLLDPSEREVAYAANSGPDQSSKKPLKRRPVFVFIMLSAAAGVGIPLLLHALESPDSPTRPAHSK